MGDKDKGQVPNGWSNRYGFSQYKDLVESYLSNGPRPGEVVKVIKDLETGWETHLHRHPEGLTISRYDPNGRPVERYNFNTGKQEK